MTRQVFAIATDESAGLAAAREALARGELVVMPTDTVYGIAADAFNAAAVGGLLAAKGRGRDMPVPVLMSEAAVLPALASEVPEGARMLADAFWPGALTLIVRRQPTLAMDLGETGGTVALRVPAHPVAQALLQAAGPLAVSSANRSGMPPATRCADAVEMLRDACAVYLDAGESPAGVPSTIIDFTSTPDGVVVRRGAHQVAALRDVWPRLDVARGQEDPGCADA